MDLFEKDMERIIAGKKAELLADLEEAKKRILHELYCVKEGIHTDACGLLADYNRIKAQLAELVTMHDNSLRLAVEKYQKMILEIMGAYENKFEGLDEIIQSIDGKVAEFDALREQLEALIGQLDGYAKEADLNQLQAELTAMIDQLRAELPDAQVQADWKEFDENSKAFIRNKPFYISEVYDIKTFVGTTLSPGEYTNTNLSSTSKELTDEEVTQLGRVIGILDNGVLYKSYGYHHPGLVDGEFVLINYSDDDIDFKVWLRKPYSNNKRVWALYVNVKNESLAGKKFGFIDAVQEIVRPETLLLGENPGPLSTLIMDEAGNLKWTTNPIIRGNDGIVYRLEVSNGVLSAVPVTN